MGDSLERMGDRIEQFNAERDWAQFHNAKDVSISLALEAAELMEHFQWKNPDEIEAHIRERKEEISDELTDVLYWVILFSRRFDIDLETAFERKMRENEEKYPVEKAKGRHSKYTSYQ